jgi:hypothetical protein
VARLLRVGGAALLVLVGACKRSTESRERASTQTQTQRVSAPVIAVDVPVPTSNVSPQLRRALESACQTLAREPCDVRDEACQERLFSLARCVSGRDGARPPLRFVSRADAPRGEHRTQTRTALVPIAHGLHLLGLEPTVGDDASATMDVEKGVTSSQSGVSTSAYYAPRDRAVYFVADDAAGSSNESARLTLVHEYLHALQDRGGELLSAQRGRDHQTFDEELATWSAFEGEATLYEELVRGLIHDRAAPGWLIQRFAERTRGTDGAVARQRRPLEASFATFPYTYGAYWAVLEVTQPVTTYEILARRHDWPRSIHPCTDETPARRVAGDRHRVRDTLGAWLVQVYVRRLTGDAERARSAAQRWRGDRLSIDSRAPGTTPSVVWQTCWDSPETALEMRELIQAQLRKSTDKPVAVTHDALRVTATVHGSDLAEHAGDGVRTRSSN